MNRGSFEATLARLALLTKNLKSTCRVSSDWLHLSNHHHPSLPSLVSFDSQLFHPSRQVLSPSLPLKPQAETQDSVIEQDSQALDQDNDPENDGQARRWALIPFSSLPSIGTSSRLAMQ
jgi:hypothetical protein